jgi:hypothetical protein
VTPHDAYKIGFQLACAARGRDAGEIAKLAYLRQQHVKQASGPLSSAYGVGKDVLGGVKSLLGFLTGWPLLGAIAAPPIAGTLGGAALSQLREPPVSSNEIRQEEMRDAYAEAVRRMRQAIEERDRRLKKKR